MSLYRERYRAKMAKQADGSNRKLRLKQAQDTYNRGFKDITGYREAVYWDRTNVDNGHKEDKPIDIVSTTNTNGYEKLITCRPNTKLAVGTYVEFKEFEDDEQPKTYIVRELIKPDPVPTYKAFECSQTMYIKGCPVPFPCFSYNSTYSSKGLIDTDRNYMLDSRNKLYIQKNAFSCRLWENYHGYRIRLGDEEGWATFKITEMDDFSYKGMFIVSLKIEQKHHLDGVEDPRLAYNDTIIDFSDLIREETEEGEVVTIPEQLYLDFEYYGRLDKTYEIIANKEIVKWDYDVEYFEEGTIKALSDSFTATPIKQGRTTITATDIDGLVVEVHVMIKEGK